MYRNSLEFKVSVLLLYLNLKTALFMTRKYSILFLLANALVLFIWSIEVYSINGNWLFPGGDGPYVLDLLQGQREFGVFGLGVAGNPLQGLGDLDFPINTWIIPALIIPSLFYGVSGAHSVEFQVLFYGISSIQLFIPVYALARVMGQGNYLAACAGWFANLLMMPLIGLPFAYPLALLAPHFPTVISVTLALVICLIVLKEKSLGRLPTHAISLSVIALALLSYILLSSPLNIMLAGPLLAAVGLTISWGLRKNIFGIYTKYLILPAIGLIVLIAPYIYGAFFYTATAFHSGEFEQIQFLSSWKYVTHIFHHDYFLVIFAFATLGILLSLKKNHLASPIAFALIILLACNGVVGYFMVIVKKYYGPAPIYFEFLYLPIIIIFSLIGLVSVIKIVYRKLIGDFLFLKLKIFIKLSIFIMFIIIIIIKWDYTVSQKTRVWGPYPSHVSGLISYLINDIEAETGEKFKGRVATFLLLNSTTPIKWLDVVGRYNTFVQTKGNDFYWGGLWYYRLPTLFKYSPLTSPLYYFYTTRIFGIEGDLQTRNVIFFRNPNFNALAALGVKYVISDKALEAPFVLVLTEAMENGEELLLYKLPNFNSGAYSPTNIRVVESLAGSLEAMISNQVDYSTIAILNESSNLKNELVVAHDIEFKLLKGGYSLKAKSTGSSMILLPIEYSNCLVFTNNAPTQNFSVKQANIIQTAIIFDSAVDIHFNYYTSPFNNSTCRIKDINNYKRLTQQ